MNWIALATERSGVVAERACDGAGGLERRVGLDREDHEVGAAHRVVVRRAGDRPAELRRRLAGPVGVARADDDVVLACAASRAASARPKLPVPPRIATLTRAPPRRASAAAASRRAALGGRSSACA